MGNSRAQASRTSKSGAKPRRETAGPTTTRYAETGYAACWFDDYDGDFGIYKVFRNRGRCLDYLAKMVFERAELLGVEVVDQSKRHVIDKYGEPVFPTMTMAEVRDHLESWMSFSLVLKTSFAFGALTVDDQVSVACCEVEIESAEDEEDYVE